MIVVVFSSYYLTILLEKSLVTPDCFVPPLVNVATKEYSIALCLETAFIIEELCIQFLVVVAAAEE